MTVCIENDAGRRPAGPSREAPGRPLILVVDDDSRTRRFVCTVLKYFTGAVVMEAASPKAALLMALALDRPIDLLVSDIELADAKSGTDLAREVTAASPTTDILLMSGRDCPPCNIPAEWRFLSKPFPTAALLDCVRALLGQLEARPGA